MESVSEKDIATLRSQNIPDWGFSLLEILNRTLIESVTKSVEGSFKKELKSEMTKLEAKVEETIQLKCDEVKSDCVAQIQKLSDKVDLALLNTDAIRSQVKKVDTRLTDKVVKLEDYSRRKNLLFSGIKEAKNEKPADCLKLVKKQLAKVKCDDNRDLSKCVVERCHRVGKRNQNQTKPRDIVCRFLDWNDRQAVSDGRKHLDKDVFVRADHAPEIANANRALKPILKVIQGTPYATKGRVQVRDGFIFVDNKKFSIRNLHQLPAGIDYYQGNHVSTQFSLAYFGILSPFSNFHWAPFEIDGVTYVCSEQYITGCLAKLFDQDDIYIDVMATCDPYLMKKLAWQIKESDRFDQAEWEEKIPQVAYDASSAKFGQNNYFAQCLIDTDNKIIAEATTEKPWGCGLKLDNQDVKDRFKWDCIGIMGETLMKVREELRIAKGLPILDPPPSIQRSSLSGSGSESELNTSMDAAMEGE